MHFRKSNSKSTSTKHHDSSSGEGIIPLRNKDMPTSKINGFWLVLIAFVLVAGVIYFFVLQNEVTQLLTQSGDVGAAAMQEKTNLTQIPITKTPKLLPHRQ